MPSYITRPRPKRENYFSLNANNLSGKILLWRLITLRETGLNGLCLKRILSFWQRVGLLEGKRGQPVGACLPFYTPCFLFFLVFPFFLFSSFSFSVFTYLLRFSPRCCYYRVRDAPLTVHGKGPLYNACRDRIL